MCRLPRSNRSFPRAVVLVLLTVGIQLGSIAAAQQFKFFLRNGDRLTGTVVAEDKSSVIITNPLVGRILIPAAQLDRREPVPATVATPAPAPPAAPSTNAAIVLTPVQRQRLNDLNQVYMAGQLSAGEFQKRRAALMAGPRPPAPKHWSGEALAGIDLGYGTKSRQNFSGRVKINYAEKRFRNAFDYLFTYGHTDGELSANRMDATDKLDYVLRTNYYLYALTGAGRDKIRQIDYQLQAGPGVGRHLIQRTNLLFNAELGGNYQLQNFEGGHDTFLFYYRVAEDLKWIISPKLSFDEKVEYTPQWNDVRQYKLRAEANLRYQLLDNLSLILTVIDMYDTRVPPGVEPNDLQVRSSLGVKF